MGRAVGIDAGGTWVRAALGDEHGRILKRMARPVDARSNDSFLSQLHKLVVKVCSGDIQSIDGIGIAVAGRIKIREGVLDYSPHMSLSGVRIRQSLEDLLKRKVIMLNDNLAAALAEGSKGAGKGCHNMVYVGIGTGIGGGVIADGRMLIGKDGNAHEIGHMIIDMDGRLPCSCGGRGHWEAYTSGSGLPNFAKFLSSSILTETPLLRQLRERRVEVKTIFNSAHEGDKFACVVIEEAARLNGLAFSNLTNLYDPELIVVGGGVALKNRDLVVDKVKPYLDNYTFNAPPAVEIASLGEEAPVVGALMSVFYPLMGH